MLKRGSIPEGIWASPLAFSEADMGVYTLRKGQKASPLYGLGGFQLIGQIAYPVGIGQGELWQGQFRFRHRGPAETITVRQGPFVEGAVQWAQATMDVGEDPDWTIYETPVLSGAFNAGALAHCSRIDTNMRVVDSKAREWPESSTERFHNVLTRVGSFSLYAERLMQEVSNGLWWPEFYDSQRGIWITDGLGPRFERLPSTFNNVPLDGADFKIHWRQIGGTGSADLGPYGAQDISDSLLPTFLIDSRTGVLHASWRMAVNLYADWNQIIYNRISGPVETVLNNLLVLPTPLLRVWVYRDGWLLYDPIDLITSDLTHIYQWESVYLNMAAPAIWYFP